MDQSYEFNYQMKNKDYILQNLMKKDTDFSRKFL